MSGADPKSDGTSMVKSQIATEMEINFLKGTQVRVVHADGVWFGGDTHGEFHLTFFNERTPIPQKVIVKINEQGQAVEDEQKRVTKKGLVREMEVDVVLSFQAALQLREALDANIKNMRQFMEKSIPETVIAAIKESIKQ